MKRNQFKTRLLSMVEGAIMIALAVVLDLLCNLIPIKHLFPFGGGVTIGFLPLVYFSLRRGTVWGLGAGFVYGVLQIITGWYAPPAGTWWAFVLCVLLDYLVAFAVVGLASSIAKPFGKYRLVGYGVGCFAVHMLRFVCSFLSGGILWHSTAPEGMNPWVYSFLYNGSYMSISGVIVTVLIVALCLALDPATLRPMKKRDLGKV